MLIVADSTGVTLFEGIILTQGHVLSIADFFVASLFDQVTLGGTNNLSIADFTSSSTFDALTLTQLHLLIVADMESGSLFDNIVLEHIHILSVSDLTVASLFDNLILEQLHVLIVEDMTVGCLFDMIIFPVAILTLCRIYRIPAESRIMDITAENRTYNVPAPEDRILTLACDHTCHGGPMKTFVHDPNAVLDYRWNWAPWLTDGETITSFTLSPPIGITNVNSGPHPNSEADGIVTGWFTGGTVGERYQIVCHIITSAGREEDATMELGIKQR
jgi:uncharacterized protein